MRTNNQIMKYLLCVLCLLSFTFLVGCESGVRDLDFINKQFQATYNLDSTRIIDSTQLEAFPNAKAIYNFGEDGKGITIFKWVWSPTTFPLRGR